MSEAHEPCWMCGASPHVFQLDCVECRRRWEDTECSELRERLFPVASPAPLPE